MEAYEGFARVYDLFMDNVDYDGWAAYLQKILLQHGIRDGLVCELACGTGSITERLSEAGYDMIGVDLSEEMLEIAQEKKLKKGSGTLYLCQDMREFELYGTVRAVVVACDGINYLQSEEDLLTVFRLVNNYLDPGGLFLFDLNTEQYYERIGDAVIAENRPEGSFIWENFFDRETGLNTYDLTIYHQEDAGRYRRYEETHEQQAYRIDRVKELLEEAGMVFETVYDAFTEKPGDETCDRVYVLAREKGK